MVITGTGDAFMDKIDGPSLGEIFKPAAWEKTRAEGAKVCCGWERPSTPKRRCGGASSARSSRTIGH
jgi:hypothetical protein